MNTVEIRHEEISPYLWCHGVTRWIEGFRILGEAGYDGFVSIEHEDGNFLGSEEREKTGLLAAKAYLESC